MRYFDPNKKRFIECDSSDIIISDIFSQLNKEGRLKFIAYFSKNINPAERNYIIYNKKILIII